MNRPLNLPPSNHDDVFGPPRKKSGLGKGVLLAMVIGGMCVVCVPVTFVVLAIIIPSSSYVASIPVKEESIVQTTFETPMTLSKDESHAVLWLRTIVTAQSLHGRGRYKTLSELLKERDLGRAMARAPLKNYRLVVILSDANDKFWVKAIPTNGSSHSRHIFYADSRGLIYYSVSAVSIDRSLEPTKRLSLYRDRRQMENERAALLGLKSINAAESIYSETKQGAGYGTLEQLYKASYVDEILGAGTKQGYKFTVTVHSKNQYSVKASPVKLGLTGSHYFYGSQDGKLYRATEDVGIDEANPEKRGEMEQIR